MRWWNRNKKAVLISLGGIFILAILGIVFLMVSGPLISGKMCTLASCVGGLQIEVIGLSESTPFEISITSPSGEMRSLSCGGETDESIPFENVCSSKGVFFSLPTDAQPSKEFMITVTTTDGEWKEVVQPDYKKIQPNGPDCEPTCYHADVVIDISK